MLANDSVSNSEESSNQMDVENQTSREGEELGAVEKVRAKRLMAVLMGTLSRCKTEHSNPTPSLKRREEIDIKLAEKRRLEQEESEKKFEEQRRLKKERLEEELLKQKLEEKTTFDLLSEEWKQHKASLCGFSKTPLPDPNYNVYYRPYKPLSTI